MVLQDAESIREELESKMTSGVSEEIHEMAESYLQENGGEVDLKVISKKAAAVAEKDMISKILRRLQWNRWKAAKELKVSYKTLLTKNPAVLYRILADTPVTPLSSISQILSQNPHFKPPNSQEV